MILLVSGCSAAAHQKSVHYHHADVASFCYNRGIINSVAVIKYNDIKYYCIKSSYRRIIEESDSSIVRKLTLKNKQILFDYLSSHNHHNGQISISGFKSLKPVIDNDNFVLYSLVPVQAVRGNK